MRWRTVVNILSLWILCGFSSALLQDQFFSNPAELLRQDKTNLELKPRTGRRDCSRRERLKCRHGHYEYCLSCSHISENPPPDSGRLIVLLPAATPGPNLGVIHLGNDVAYPPSNHPQVLPYPGLTGNQGTYLPDNVAPAAYPVQTPGYCPLSNFLN